MHLALIVGASFFASLVEAVEALTIVLATGLTRGWRSSLVGAGVASLALVAIVGLLGPTLILAIPIEALQVLVGTLLLAFGLQWLRKAILRRAGLKAMHDEAAIFAREIHELASLGAPRTFDWTGFTLSFKGVFLEGLEVAFIVLTFGTDSGNLAGSTAGAVAAVVLIVAVGAFVHRPLSRVPENDLKFAVGLLLASFGTFWLGEGAGVTWRLEDATILVLLALYAAVGLALARYLARPRGAAATRAGA